MRPLILALALSAAVPAAFAGTLTVAPTTVPEWKAVYGRVEARDLIPARARIGGTLVALEVTEGDAVKAGQRIATVRDDKIAFQVNALDAQLRALQAQLANAESELARGQALVEKGVTTAQRLDQLRTQTDVFRNQIAAAEAQRQVVVQQGQEGEVIAPADGKVLTVPVTKGAVVMPGEAIATIGGGGFFLRLAIPERHAAMLEEGAALQIETGSAPTTGRLAKVYPQIENGRVIADVEVEALPTAFVDARLLVRVPVGARQAIVVPAAAVSTRSGIDFVRVRAGDAEIERVVVVGERTGTDVEVLTGLHTGDEVITP
ncbi:efflux RND transporter periplasmic adaptor subunit [Chthonobacter albigriseus]|uniref:efflux RND transporter periplasmic adaptor subunit n=1 Tax=Chthonobacter albigriseus TaxID=1683161 RepID=UPI0015EE481E|nr:efflux RND transporter periplasmic adaptor subunit [Chthonobacter albigriseus]